MNIFESELLSDDVSLPFLDFKKSLIKFLYSEKLLVKIYLDIPCTKDYQMECLMQDANSISYNLMWEKRKIGKLFMLKEINAQLLACPFVQL